MARFIQCDRDQPFLLRGLEKVRLEWQLVALAYNCRRLHTLMRGA